MWDFLRDLGEINVGGSAIIKDVQDNNTDFGLQSMTQTRLHNVAKAYGWWIAKDSVSLLILKVCLNFMTVFRHTQFLLQGRGFHPAQSSHT